MNRNFLSFIALSTIFIAIVLFVTYGNTLSGEFLSDDWGRVCYVKSTGLIQLLYHYCFKAPICVFRPMAFLIWKCNQLLWKSNSLGYHLVVIIFHFFNAFLILLIFTYIFPQNRRIGLFTATLFSVFPLHSEGVVWLAAAIEGVFATFFTLLSFLALLLFFKKSSKVFLLFSIFTFSLALLSKETTFCFPLVLVLYDFLFGEKIKWENRRKKILVHLPFFCLVIAGFIIRCIRLGGIGGYTSDGVSIHTSLPVFKMLRNMFFVPYKSFVFPFNYLIFKGNVLCLLRICFGIIYGSLLLFFLNNMKLLTMKKLLSGIGWVAINMLPVANFFSLGYDLQSSRLLYLPSIGWCLIIGVILGVKKDWLKQAATIVFTLLLLFYMGVLTRNNSAWNKAAELSYKIPRQVKAIFPQFSRSVNLYFFNIPDNYKGAYVYRNYLTLALSLLYHKYPPKAWLFHSIGTDRVQSFNPEKLKIGETDFFLYFNDKKELVEKVDFKLEGKKIDFTLKSHRRYLIQGWNITEDWGTWARGSESLIFVSLKPGKTYKMIIRAKPLTGLDDVQTIEVFIKNTLLSKLSLKNPTFCDYEIIIPPDLTFQMPLMIKFRYKYSKSPSELGLWEYELKLSVAFSQIRFEEI